MLSTELPKSRKAGLLVAALRTDCVLYMCCSYSKLSEDEVRLDRYAKFRALGQYEEYLVPGGQWRETRAARDKVWRNLAAHTASGLSALV